MRTGIIRNTTDYGVFIDFGGIDGLCHIFELSNSYLNHAREAVSIGDAVEVY